MGRIPCARGEQFHHMEFFGQRLATGSFVYPLRDAHAETNYAGYMTQDKSRQEVCELPAPIYFFAVCSDDPKAVRLHGLSPVYFDRGIDLFREQVAEWLRPGSRRESFPKQISG